MTECLGEVNACGISVMVEEKTPKGLNKQQPRKEILNHEDNIVKKI